MACTQTGSFPIGIRCGGWEGWLKDLPSVLSWLKANEFEVVDVSPLPPAKLATIPAAGLRIGTVNLPRASDLVSPDAAKRHDAVQFITEYAKSVAPVGTKLFFTAVTPAEPNRPRKENFAFAVDGYGQLCTAIAAVGAKIAIEGWPGPPPHSPHLACTPADIRALLKELPGNAMINYDPSHLIRMGIDPVPFLEEFAHRVAHVHGKDTEILTDEMQEHGILQTATFEPKHKFGGHYWRYCVPGHGVARWGKMFRILKEANYQGAVCIELEDENFRGNTEVEQRGFVAGLQFLKYV